MTLMWGQAARSTVGTSFSNTRHLVCKFGSKIRRLRYHTLCQESSKPYLVRALLFYGS